jgi:hypothetical protein
MTLDAKWLPANTGDKHARLHLFRPDARPWVIDPDAHYLTMCGRVMGIAIAHIEPPHPKCRQCVAFETRAASQL